MLPAPLPRLLGAAQASRPSFRTINAAGAELIDHASSELQRQQAVGLGPLRTAHGERTDHPGQRGGHARRTRVARNGGTQGQALWLTGHDDLAEGIARAEIIFRSQFVFRSQIIFRSWNRNILIVPLCLT